MLKHRTRKKNLVPGLAFHQGDGCQRGGVSCGGLVLEVPL